MEKKRYYSTLKPYAKRKKRRPLLKAALRVFKKFYKKTAVVLSEPLPDDEPIVILCNHARDYAPLAFLTAYRRKNRMWSTGNLCHAKKVPNHIMYCFFPNAKGVGAFFLRIFSFLAAPVFPALFSALEVIPSYQNINALVTFSKTVETLKEGMDVIIFPETEVSHPAYKYTNKINGGFLRVARKYYLETGKNLRFYPAYAAKSLGILYIGKPITLQQNSPQKPQFHEFKIKVMDEIEHLGNSLPPHKITPFAEAAQNIEKLKKYIDPDKYRFRDLKERLESENCGDFNELTAEN